MIKNKPQDFIPQDDKLYGIYRGVVEDNKDPDKMGRCRIRVFGIHTEIKNQDRIEGIPTDHLPWAEPALGLFEGSVSGFGGWTIPLQGSHLFLFFENGNILQPRYFASAPGLPTDKNHGYPVGSGFSDPDGVYPKENRLNEPDLHRLARDEYEKTAIEYRKDNKDENVSTAMGNADWSEPDPFYLKNEEKYPNNIVFATHSGIIVELDNSQNPRLHVYHPSNSYMEIDSEGNQILRNNGIRYDIILKDHNIHNKQNRNITVEENKNEKINGDKNVEIGGDKNVEIGGDKNVEIGGDKNDDISGSLSITLGANGDITVNGDCNINASGNVNITGGGMVTITGATVSIN